MSVEGLLVLLVGQPNAGKTTLFNWLTGSQYKTVNYPGATVEILVGKLKNVPEVSVIDSPGIRGLQLYSPEEKLTMDLLENPARVLGINYSKTVLLVPVDLTQRSRHLVLVKQLIDSGFSVLVVLTMVDLAGPQAKNLNLEILEQKLGCAIFQVNGKTGDGIGALHDGIRRSLDTFSSPRPPITSKWSMADLYQWADQVIREASVHKIKGRIAFDVDNIFLHPVFGIFCFCGIMGAFFLSIFLLAAPLMEGLSQGFALLSSLLGHVLPRAFWATFISDGLVDAVGAVVVFVPQIAILFLGIGILESTGYLARGAAIVEKPLRKIGLGGRSFVPLLSGFACAIPAMMATRTIPDARQRRRTLSIIPIMQCSARLPVYGMLLALLFNGNPWKASLGLMAIYMGSIVAAGLILGVWTRIADGPNRLNTPFHLELPMWRWPVWHHLFVQVSRQTWNFVAKAGPMILLVSLVLWGLSHFPSDKSPWIFMLGHWIEPIFLPMGLDWRVGVALLLSFAAREVFVSALVLVFSATAGDLLQVVGGATLPSGQALFTVSSVIGLVLFFMFAMQCASTVAVAKKEMAEWRRPLFLTVGYILGAYILAVVVVQGLRFLGVS